MQARFSSRHVFSFVTWAMVTTSAAFLSGCPTEPCCTADSDCAVGLGCFDGECTHPCESNLDCADDELCIRPEGAASSFGVCRIMTDDGAERICREREPLPPPDAGPPLEPDAEPSDEPEVGPDEPEPPPPCVPDVYEPNDLRGLGQTNPASPTALTLCRNDEDWFSFDLREGDRIRFRIEFVNAVSDIDLAFFSPEPFSEQIATSTTTNDFESFDVVALSDGLYAARVYPFEQVATEYLLFVEIDRAGELDGGPDLDAGPVDGGPPDCRDNLEPNDTQETARALIPNGDFVDLTLCGRGDVADIDYFSVFVPEPSILEVSGAPSSNAFLEVRSPSGELLSSSRTGSTFANTSTPGEYIVTVFSNLEDQPQDYRLFLALTPAVPDAGPPPDAGPQCDRGPNEPNDTPQQAAIGGTGAFSGRLCPGDEDWVTVSLDEGQRLVVEQNNPALTFFFHAPLPGAEPLGFSDALSSTFVAPSTGRHFLRVVGTSDRDYRFVVTIDDAPVDAGVPDAGPPPDAGICVDDAFEPNNGIDDATAVSIGLTNATLCEDDEDFFGFDAAEGQVILLEVSGVVGSDVSLQLFGPDGFISQGNPGVDGVVRIAEAVLTTGRYVARVFDAPDQTDYGLRLQLIGDPGCLSDALEPNDSRNAPSAAPIGEPIDLEICDGDVDFFFVDLEAGQELTAQIFFDGGSGDTDLDMRLFGPEPNGSQVDRSFSTSGTETVSVLATQPGRYVIEVFGFSGAENAYLLQVFVSDQQCVNDAFEPNDRRFDAAFIEPDQLSFEAQLCPADLDFFDVVVTNNSSITLAYDPVVPLRLQAQRFGEIIAESTGGFGFEEIFLEEEGDYTLRIDAPFEPVPSDFDLFYAVDIIPGFDGCLEDLFEPNDSFNQATELVLNGQSTFAAFCDGNLDMFRIRPTSEALEIGFFAPNDTISLSVVDEITFEFFTVEANEFRFVADPSSRYLLVVNGSEDINQYEIIVNEF